MELRPTVMTLELTALLIAPDRDLAEQFTASQSGCRAFQILSDLKSYPSRQTLEIRLKQLCPDLVIIDAGSNLEAAGDAIQFIVGLGRSVQVVGLHPRNDSEALLTCLRLGACEFLHAPFDALTQQDAFVRLLRLRAPAPAIPSQPGTVVVYTCAKPGSGASTLAFHTACSVHRATRKKVLLIDLDLTNGVIGFQSKLSHAYSVLDALERAEELSPATWDSLIAPCCGMDILPAPAAPYCGPVEAARLTALFDYARANYDCVLVDAPVIFRRLSLMALSNADRALLVSTGEVGSVHLTRKAVQLLDRLGFPKDRFHIVVNRVTRNDDVAPSDLEKLFTCHISSRLPYDPLGLHRVLTLGGPLESDSELGRGIRDLAAGLVAAEDTSAVQLTAARVQ
jgi:pilus assembly protein CpaE